MARRLLRLAYLVVLATACDSRVGGLVGVTPPGTKLVFLNQPSNVQVGAAISPTVQVAVQNNNNQTVTTSTASIALSIVPGTGATGAVLMGGTAQTATGGVVGFNNLRIDLAGTGYQLLATAQGLTSVASAAFDVTP